MKPTKPAESRISESEKNKCKRLTNILAKTLLYFSSDYARSNPLILKTYVIYWMRKIMTVTKSQLLRHNMSRVYKLKYNKHKHQTDLCKNYTIVNCE
jgi:hypothetical protein